MTTIDAFQIFFLPDDLYAAGAQTPYIGAFKISLPATYSPAHAKFRQYRSCRYRQCQQEMNSAIERGRAVMRPPFWCFRRDKIIGNFSGSIGRAYLRAEAAAAGAFCHLLSAQPVFSDRLCALRSASDIRMPPLWAHSCGHWFAGDCPKRGQRE